MAKVVMVKKRLASGEPCAKCAQAEQMLRSRGVWDEIERVVWADETDASSEGMRLAAEYNVTLAPFYLVTEDGKPRRAETSTVRVAKLLQSGAPAHESVPATTRAPLAPQTKEDVRQAAMELSDAAPQDILRWGLERLGMQLGIAFSGAEDVALIEMAKQLDLPFSVFCLDTGRLHAETYQFIDRVRRHYDVEIQLMSPQAQPLQEMVRKKGLFSFYEDGHQECCGIRKIEPLRRALSGLHAWASGQRRDQSPTRADVEVLEVDESFQGAGPLLLKLNPLAHWTSQQVWEFIRDNGVPYNALHDSGFISIGCQPCTRPSRPGEHERAARWWWEESTQRECGLHVKK